MLNIISQLSIKQRIAVLAAIGMLVVISVNVERISATQYEGHILLKNVGATTVSIEGGSASVVDKNGKQIISVQLTNLPLVIQPGESNEVIGDIQLSDSLEALDAQYGPGDKFIVNLNGMYTERGFVRGLDFTFEISKSEMLDLYRVYKALSG